MVRDKWKQTSGPESDQKNIDWKPQPLPPPLPLEI